MVKGGLALPPIKVVNRGVTIPTSLVSVELKKQWVQYFSSFGLTSLAGYISVRYILTEKMRVGRLEPTSAGVKSRTHTTGLPRLVEKLMQN